MTTNPPDQLLMPAVGSTVAGDIDSLYYFLVYMSLILFVLITGAVVYFMYKYPRKAGDEKKLSIPTIHSMALEIFWSVGPLLVCIGIFHYGAKQFMSHRVAPRDSIEVRVRAKKWSWSFEYPNGKTSGNLYAPLNKPVKLVMTSKDVLHSFYVPTFRIKQDVVPGRYTMVWFQATIAGDHQIFCTEYCGKSHSDMLAKVKVKSPEEFDKWLNADPYKDKKPEEIGKLVFEMKGCGACHSIDGSVKVGPSLKGLWGKTESFTDGSTHVVDAAYIKESLLVPGAKVVKGFPNQMTSFQGDIKPIEIDGIVAYIQSLK
jgi:cytochrome c oxidase subunit II